MKKYILLMLLSVSLVKAVDIPVKMYDVELAQEEFFLKVNRKQFFRILDKKTKGNKNLFRVSAKKISPKHSMIQYFGKNDELILQYIKKDTRNIYEVDIENLFKDVE